MEVFDHGRSPQPAWECPVCAGEGIGTAASPEVVRNRPIVSGKTYLEGWCNVANPFVHVELNTGDAAKAKEFYGKLFTWELQDMPMESTTYTMIDVGDSGTGGGIAQISMPGNPSAWIPYVLVDDVTAATSKAKSLGAQVYKDVTEIREMGSFSIIADPTGAVLGLWEAKQ